MRALAAAFAQAGIESAHEDARILLQAAGGISRAQLISEPGEPLAAAALTRLAAAAKRRLAREPVSRILGRREFWSLEFKLSRAVLDPRASRHGRRLCLRNRRRPQRVPDGERAGAENFGLEP